MNDNKLSLGLASLPLVAMVVLFAFGAAFMEMNNELLLLVMLSAAAVATVVAQRVGKSWDDVQRSTGDKLAAALPALLILLSIGLLIGTWVCSGTIPLMVYYGLKLVNPNYLAVTAFLATSVMSLCTGTSWGSAGTIGVALMGMATALGAPLAPMAGAIVSGAYFGDKMSPLSDSTNIAAIGAGSQLYPHIRLMIYTSGPSYLIAGIVYAVAVKVPGNNGELPPAAERLLNELSSVYSLSAITLLPIIVVIIGIVQRTAPVITIVISSAVAALIGMALQGFSLESVLMSAVRGFDVTMLTDKGLDPHSLHVDTLALLNRGGMYSMSNTLLVIIAAFLLAGAMDVSGALDRLISQLLTMVSSTFALIAATMAAGAAMISLTSNNGVTALVIGELFQKAYDERGFARENLSRSIEDSVTIVEPLLPWTVSAVYMATTLGVPTISYAPWAFFCIGGPVFSLLYAATYDRLGFGLRRARVSVPEKV
jgi:Na+:H+ antiporter, NhaC family